MGARPHDREHRARRAAACQPAVGRPPVTSGRGGALTALIAASGGRSNYHWAYTALTKGLHVQKQRIALLERSGYRIVFERRRHIVLHRGRAAVSAGASGPVAG